MRIALALTLALAAGCDQEVGFDPHIAVTAANETTEGTARLESGRVAVRVTACVPGLRSARATLVDPRADLADGGVASPGTVVLGVSGDVPNCNDGGLSVTTSVPAEPGERIPLYIEALGTTASTTVQVEAPAPPFELSEGQLEITFSPDTIPPGGGVIEALVTVASDIDAEGRSVAFQTLPAVPLAPASARLDDAGQATTAFSVPEDVREVQLRVDTGGRTFTATVSEPP